MTYKAHVENGRIVLDEPAELPEGVQIRVMVLDASGDARESTPNEIPTHYERLKAIIGIAEGLPEDLAENHDHYLHGRPKK